VLADVGSESGVRVGVRVRGQSRDSDLSCSRPASKTKGANGCSGLNRFRTGNVHEPGGHPRRGVGVPTRRFNGAGTQNAQKRPLARADAERRRTWRAGTVSQRAGMKGGTASGSAGVPRSFPSKARVPPNVPAGCFLWPSASAHSAASARSASPAPFAGGSAQRTPPTRHPLARSSAMPDPQALQEERPRDALVSLFDRRTVMS
jgi:hypothetical protein